jgi:hypothetical protein
MFQPPTPYGQLVTFLVGTPAAGANFSFVVPNKGHIRILGVKFDLLADANVANRYAALHAYTPALPWTVISPGTLQTASQNVSYNFAINTAITSANPGGVPIQAFAPLPYDLILRGDNANPDELRSLVSNIQVGDQISNIRLRYEMWTHTDIT